MKPERTKELNEAANKYCERFDDYRHDDMATAAFIAGAKWMEFQSSPVESKWVYGINSGCRYEGGGVRGSLYATEELVRVKFNELLQEKEQEYRGMCEHFGEEYKYKWKKEERTSFMEYWSNGVDYIAIDKMQVLTELPIEETKEK